MVTNDFKDGEEDPVLRRHLLGLEFLDLEDSERKE